MRWKFYPPSPILDTMDVSSAWSGHRQFGYDLVRNMKPRKIVELGTHYGYSFFSFCQAVKDGRINADCYAIDTWQGDPHSGLYGEDVFAFVEGVVDGNYGQFAHLFRCTFDAAVSRFKDGSIDLLHIDGYHTYEAVTHDYQTWLPKLADGGVVLLHDIHTYLPGFGVHTFWNVLRSLPHIEFSHSCGLGVVMPKGCPKKLQALISEEKQIKAHYEKG